MKPYRGTLLAAAVLLATLQVSGCGKAGDWEKTTEVKLSTSTASVEVKHEVILTATAPPPAAGYQCDTLLEYRAQGAAMNFIWVPVPGTEATRVWSVWPHGVGTLSVVARGKCEGAKEDWKYSNQVDVEVTEAILPIVTAVTLTSNVSTVKRNTPVVFTLGASTESGCTLHLEYTYVGGGFSQTTVIRPPGIFTLTPPGAVTTTTLTVIAAGWCTENPSAVVSSDSVSVTVEP